ncbi:aminopeptidase N [Pontibacter ummariensis]|uniref:Aminopeptidase N n=1 Tax=Pontibacter ummariensis TaxID=1610492 RepID=A0A239B030_9BACT|nr:M1 family metallopeptidase [Pontibacter ummariensis]PRY16181.1 aminopeptidase N [Pontibacter ummariensis]SNS00598.1 aminopeptidase N [Pontibacter ummariensis]
MNHRFLSIVGLAAAMAFTSACSANKAVVDTQAAQDVKRKVAVAPADTVPAWAPKKHQFNPSRTNVHDLLHTTLRVGFDWEKQYLNGLAELRLKPYFYPQDSLVLDAKGMDIHSVNLMKGFDATPLQYAYDGQKLRIKLDKTYTRNEEYVVEIDYTAKPNELPAGGSDAITADKGLYFINPLGEEPNKPQQIWTQGETEASSAWFPTIDAPNERMTQDIYITVDPKFTTLSNGVFMYSRKNADGTKTDYWRQELPHAPYLAMMAIGEFAQVKDKWRDRELTYYVEPEYQGTAKKIFGNTPEMMEFFSKKLGVAYPWPKYAQVVVRDYVSGAMENTSASVFMEDLQLNERELLDKNWDGIIAHELFHQWFGDYVTTESWANLPLNEAFANYSEYLWAEHKFGADEAAYLQLDELGQYLDEAETKREPLIRYYYGDKEDMFDAHSYAKGGRVLHMLRKLVGDEAFFASLNRYLTDNKFSAVEVAELRMAFEDVTGMDLMWFFDQWFMQPGHPELQVAQTYQNGQLSLQVKQVQDTAYMPVYRLPLEVAVWAGGKKTTYPIVVDKANQTFTFNTATKPELVLFDAEQQLLGTVAHEKSEQELLYQFYHAGQLAPKLEALTKLEEKLQNPEVLKMYQAALKDDYWRVRSTGINALSNLSQEQAGVVAPTIKQMALEDEKGAVRADAVLALAGWGGEKYKAVFEQAMQDSSYQAAAAGIMAYAGTGAADIRERLRQFEEEKNEEIVLALATNYAVQAGPEKYDWFVRQINQAKGGGLYYLLQSFGAFLAGNSETNTPEAINLLAGIAQNHRMYYVRASAYQALMVMSERPEVQALLNEIRQNETDKRLLEMYGQ